MHDFARQVRDGKLNRRWLWGIETDRGGAMEWIRRVVGDPEFIGIFIGNIGGAGDLQWPADAG